MPRFDVYGRRLTVTRIDGRWHVAAEGADGKHRDARISIPDSVLESHLARYLADVFPEDASPERPDVVRLD